MNLQHTFTTVLAVMLGVSACAKRSSTDDEPLTAGIAGSAHGGSDANAFRIQTEAGPQRLDCSAINGGPSMVQVATPAGAKYCIDTTEVTQKQYAEFLASTTQKPGTEHPSCSWNNEYAPMTREGDMPGRGCPYGEGSGPDYWYSPDKTPNRPVMCIDWCDAVAFCQWAGKRLCGKVGGGSVPFAQHADANVSEWYNACSNGGKTAFSYGDTYQPSVCSPPRYDAGSPGIDIPSSPQCHGTNPPFSAIYDMSGSAAEWQDECEPGNGQLLCVPVGGASVYPEQTRCDSLVTVAPELAGGLLGFRCCKD